MNEIERLRSAKRSQVVQTLLELCDTAEPGEPELEAQIIRLTASDDPKVRTHAIECLGCRGSDAELCKDALLRCLPGGSEAEQMALCQAIANLGRYFPKDYAVFQDFVLQSLQHPNFEVRRWALDAADSLSMPATHPADCERVRKEVSASVQQAWDETFGTS